MKKKYAHILFDLDHTLWDTNTNAQQTIIEMFSHFRLESLGIADPEKFVSVYKGINEKMWNDYSLHRIEKKELRYGRFRQTLIEFGIGDELLVEEMSNFFSHHTPQKSVLIENAKELLDFLHKKYKLHIVTNGFREAQHLKLKNSGIEYFFDTVFISEEIGYNKPHNGFFDFVLSKLNTTKDKALMVGDNLETDIAGAVNAGIDCVFYNPVKVEHAFSVSYEIENLLEIKNFL